MKRICEIRCRLAAFCLVLAGAVPSVAETVPMKQAKAMAQNFFNESRRFVTGPVTYVYNGKDLSSQRLFTPFYVFNSPTGGFVIISADNKAFPILGFSLTRNFDKKKLTPMTKSILSDFSRDIEMIRFDSRIPSDAIAEWNSYPQVVFDIFGNEDGSDYYPVSYNDGDEMWMVRRNATEFDFETSEPVEYAFKPAEVEEIAVPAAPVVSHIGGGRFSLSLPVGIKRMIVYNVAGSIVQHRTFRDSEVAHADLAAEPNGFYIAVLIDVNGVCHAAKLYR